MKRLLSKIKHYLLVSIVLEIVTVLDLSENQVAKEEILLSKHVAELQTSARVTVDTYQFVSCTFTCPMAPVFYSFIPSKKMATDYFI